MRDAHPHTAVDRVTGQKLIDTVNRMPIEEVLARLDDLKTKRRSAVTWGVERLLQDRAISLLGKHHPFWIGEGDERPAAVMIKLTQQQHDVFRASLS